MGFTEAQITDFGMTFGLGTLIVLMLVIVAKLAWDCRAGKFGTFILFVGLGLGIFGFLAKYVIQDLILIK
jgi:hypothetical protein